MSSLLARVADALTHHWKRSLAAALVLLVVLGALSAASGSAPADYGTPGAESQKAYDLLADRFPDQANASQGSTATVVFHAERGTLRSDANQRTIRETVARIAKQDGVQSAAVPTARGTTSPDGRTAFTTVAYDVKVADLKKTQGEDLEKALEPARRAGLQVESRGQVVDQAAEQSFPVGELVGVLIAIVLLTLLFRSLAAMFATIVGALLGVVFGQLVLAVLAEPLGLPDFAAQIAAMLGIGAGIDYALLIIGRYREEVASGKEPREASAAAARTAGVSVFAAGLIIVVAIAGLTAIGIPLIGNMGIGAAIAVFAVVVSSLTVTPIMIGALSKRIAPKKPEHTAPSPGFARWGRVITGRPWTAMVVGGVVLIALASPITSLRLGNPDDSTKASSTTQNKAYDLLSEGFGPGFNGPFLLAVSVPKGDAKAPAQLATLRADLARTPGVQTVAPPVTNPAKDAAIVNLVPTTSPQSDRTSDLVDRLRDRVIPASTEGTGLQVFVGGQVPGFEDFSAKVESRLPVFILIVIGLSILLLIAAFRSLWVPLASAVFNLLSIGAAYGVVVAVFQKGVGSSLIGVDSGVPIISFLPVMMFAILFGLSMDYNVFLLSRIREAYHEGKGPKESVVVGMSRIAKVILTAGLIMTAVFLAFTTGNDVIIKMFGVGLGSAILIDVLIVRLLVAPAVVTLLGDHAWWLPKWLDRVIPDVSLEGAEPAAAGPAATAGKAGPAGSAEPGAAD